MDSRDSPDNLVKTEIQVPWGQWGQWGQLGRLERLAWRDSEESKDRRVSWARRGKMEPQDQRGSLDLQAPREHQERPVQMEPPDRLALWEQAAPRVSRVSREHQVSQVNREVSGLSDHWVPLEAQARLVNPERLGSLAVRVLRATPVLQEMLVALDPRDRPDPWDLRVQPGQVNLVQLDQAAIQAPKDFLVLKDPVDSRDQVDNQDQVAPEETMALRAPQGPAAHRVKLDLLVIQEHLVPWDPQEPSVLQERPDRREPPDP
jgi:hypothetical protein